MNRKVPLHLITGFLGSGKTTLLKQLINYFAPREKLLIIQNEFAPANVDGEEISRTQGSYELLELNNGSVFCLCMMGNFIEALNTSLDEVHPDRVIIEASGLADPISLAEIISSPGLSHKVYLSATICLIDAVNYLKIEKMATRLNHQIQVADLILINKSDLAHPLDDIKQRLEALNPAAEILTSMYARFDFNKIENFIAAVSSLKGVSEHRPEVNSMVIRSSRKASADKYEEWIHHFAARSYRIKGTIRLDNGSNHQVQTVMDQVVISPSAYRGRTELVAITDQFSLSAWHQSFKKLLS
ncbi:MAG: CobW family GTP-binding protein [Candidatus Cyclobacteriaceae bacterium M3_2C_046]